MNEGRKKAEIRSPKHEPVSSDFDLRSSLGFRPSDSGLRGGFGRRVSNFHGSRHLKRAVIILAAVGGKEIRVLSIPFIVVNTTRPPTEVSFTAETEHAVRLRRLQRHLVAKPEHLLVGGVEPRAVSPVVPQRNDATQIAVMPVDIA